MCMCRVKRVGRIRYDSNGQALTGSMADYACHAPISLRHRGAPRPSPVSTPPLSEVIGDRPRSHTGGVQRGTGRTAHYGVETFDAMTAILLRAMNVPDALVPYVRL